MPETPLFSIIINNYNYARYIRCAIESALAQTWSNVEVIVVDDGSTDESAAHISSYGDRVTPLLKANGGQASALNAGFEKSRGKWIMFLDADDVLLPDALERFAARFRSEAVSKVASPLFVIGAGGNLTGQIVPSGKLPEGNLLSSTIDRGPSSHRATPTSGNAWSRKYLERILPIPENAFRLCADYYLADNSTLYGPIGALDEPVGFYRIHGANGYANTKVTLDILNRFLALYEMRCSFLESRLSENLSCSKETWLRLDERYVMLGYLRWKLFGLRWKDWSLPSFLRHGLQCSNRTRRLPLCAKFLLMHFGPRKFVDRTVRMMFDPGLAPLKKAFPAFRSSDPSYSRFLGAPVPEHT